MREGRGRLGARAGGRSSEPVPPARCPVLRASGARLGSSVGDRPRWDEASTAARVGETLRPGEVAQAGFLSKSGRCPSPQAASEARKWGPCEARRGKQERACAAWPRSSSSADATARNQACVPICTGTRPRRRADAPTRLCLPSRADEVRRVQPALRRGLTRSQTVSSSGVVSASPKTPRRAAVWLRAGAGRGPRRGEATEGETSVMAGASLAQ